MYVCSCSPGYRGRVCFLDVDECASLPCGAGGRCRHGVAVFECEASLEQFGAVENGLNQLSWFKRFKPV